MATKIIDEHKLQVELYRDECEALLRHIESLDGSDRTALLGFAAEALKEALGDTTEQKLQRLYADWRADRIDDALYREQLDKLGHRKDERGRPTPK